MKKKYIKYTLFGFNQLKAHNLGLDLVDLALMRWFIDFKDFKDKETGKRIMVSKVIDGEVMYWIHYAGVIEALPIVKLKNADSVYRRFKKLVKCEILEHKTVKQGGVYSYYTTGKKYGELISEEYLNTSEENPTVTDKNPTVTDKNPTVMDKNPMKTDENPEQKINLIQQSNNNKSNKEQKELLSFRVKEKIFSILNENKVAFDTWFLEAEFIELEEKLVMETDDEIIKEHLPKRYIQDIEKEFHKKLEIIEITNE